MCSAVRCRGSGHEAERDARLNVGRPEAAVPAREEASDPAATRQDAALDFNWGRGSPDPAVPADNFSAVWTRSVEFGGGRYTFTTYSDDGVRLYVDDQLVIDSWRPMRGYRSGTLSLSEGTHTVRLKYFERTGVALARLTWRHR